MGRLPVVSFDRSEMESALLCLVCGPRGRHAATLSVEDVLTAATTVCARLRAAHWRRWHRRLRDALDASAGPSQVEEVGQVLEMFRKFGPGRLARSRAHAGDPFEILVAGSARLWPTR